MINSLKIITLVEDSSPLKGFLAEHGLSFWIEADKHKFLFDTGQSGIVLKHNLQILGLDLKELNAVILSHPHYDHAGGLATITQDVRDIPLFCTTDITDNKDVDIVNFTPNFLKAHLEIFPGIFLSKERNSETFRKPVKETNLVINLKNKGLVLIVGCAHHGLENIINNAKSIYPNTPLHALIGGLHLKDLPKAEMEKYIELLRQEKIAILAPNHCTGFKAIEALTKMNSEGMKIVSESVSGTFHTGKILEL